MATITSNGTGGGNWGTAATWAGAAVPVDNDTVVIAAGDTVTFDVDTSAWANGIAGITITSDATTPGMLRAKYDADGTYYLKLKTGTTIAGTNAAVFGRLLANSDGVWGNTGALAFGRKFVIEMGLTGKIDARYLDIALYGYQPTVLSATVYNTIQTVSSIDTGTDVITLGGAHGWTAGTAVMVTSSGTYPGGLAADTVYYVRSPSGADLKLALQNADAQIVDITSSGSGTIRIFDGHTNTGTATVNVLEDLTAVTGWTTTAGHNYVVLADAAAPENYDQQRLQLTTINAGSLVLSANVDSAQYPGAKVWLVSRNVSILSACTTAVNIVDYGAGTHGGVFACQIRSTAGTGTTFYGNGVNGGAGHTVSGTVSGCSNGVYIGTGHTVSGTVSGCGTGVNGGTGHTVSGTVSGCSNGVYIGAGHTVSGTVSGCSNGVNGGTGHTVSGTVSGCSNGVNGGTGHTISGTVSGCSSGVYVGTGHTVSGTVSGCGNGVNIGTGHTVSGTVSGCGTGVNGGTGHTVSGTVSGCSNGVYIGTGHTVSGTVSGCSNGVYIGTGHTVSGTVSGCSNGVNGGTGFLYGATFSDNTSDMYPNGGYWQGWGVTLSSATQCTYYKHSQIASNEDRNAAVAIMDLGGVSEALGFWTLGGYTKSATYAVGTHGTPPVALSLVHETTFEDNDRLTWAEYAIWGVSGQQVSVTFYGKLTGTAAWTTRPSIGIYDPTEGWQSVDEDLSTVETMANNTDWQTLTVTYTPTRDRELRVRMQGCGGNAGGTGTEQLYWYAEITPSPAGSGGGGGRRPQLRVHGG